MSDVLRNQVLEPKKRYIPKVRFTEDQLQRKICTYLKVQYTHVIFRSDLDSGRAKDSHFQRGRMVAMNSSRSFPDLFIYDPRTIKGQHYCCLAIELKSEGTSVIMKIGPRKGRLSLDKHIQEQAAMLKSLIAKGYYANFAVGYDEAIKLIDFYMGKPQTSEMF